MRIFIATLCLIYASIGFSETVKLQAGDSKRFNPIWVGLGSNTRADDPNDSRSWYLGVKYQSDSQNLASICWTHYFDGLEGSTNCEVSFSLDQPNSDWGIEKVRNAVIIKTSKPAIASKLFRNMHQGSFKTAELGKLNMPDGSQIDYPKLQIRCEPDNPDQGTAKSCEIISLVQ